MSANTDQLVRPFSNMFAKQTDWDNEENRITTLLRKKLAGGETVIDLTEANPTSCGLLPPEDFLEEFHNPANLAYDPHPRGLPAARKSIAAWYRGQGIFADTEEIILTAGTSEAYSYLFHLLCDPGDSILIPAPGYPLLDYLGQLHNLSTRKYRLRYDGDWHLDADSLAEPSLHQAKALVLINPHNPTGSFVKPDDLKLLDQILGKSIPFIFDEVFSPFTLTDHGSPPSFPVNRLTFRLNGLSKMAGLPQMKLAWIVVSGPEQERKEAIRRLEIIADTFLSVNTPIQIALPAILPNLDRFITPILERIRKNHALLKDAFGSGLPLSLLRSEGGWNAVIGLPATRTGEEWCLRFLEEQNVLVYPGDLFDFGTGSYAVVSLLPKNDDFSEGIRRIVRSMTF